MRDLIGGEAWPVALGPQVGQQDTGRMRGKGLPPSSLQGAVLYRNHSP